MSAIFLNESIELNTTTTVTPAMTTVTQESSTTQTFIIPNVTVISLRERITGYCDNITSGIHVDIMYTEAGLSNGQPRYEIVGAHIR